MQGGVNTALIKKKNRAKFELNFVNIENEFLLLLSII